MATKLNLREFNKKNIYNLIYESDGISKADISRKLQLSLQTVCYNLTDLRAQGLVFDDGTFDSTGGRRAKVIRVVADARFSLGIDITKNHIGLVLIDLQCNILRSVRLLLEFRDTPAYFEKIGRIVDDFLRQSGVDRSKILGAGVSLPAIISADGKHITYLKIFSASDNIYEKLSADELGLREMLSPDGVTKARKAALEHLRQRYPDSALYRWRRAFRQMRDVRADVR